MSTLSSIIIASLIVSLISLIGGLLLLWKKLLTEKLSPYWVSFAAGVMLSSALLDLLPEALEIGSDQTIFIAILFGITLFFFLERFVLWFHHHDDTHNAKPSTLLILLGDSLHNMFDGVAIAAAFLTNPAVGITATLAISAHEIPQEIADFNILIAGGLRKRDALFFNLLSAFTALIGAILGFYFLDRVARVLPLFLAFTSGMFIYIACSDLIPDMHKEFQKQKGWINSVPFLIGIVTVYALITLLEGSH